MLPKIYGFLMTLEETQVNHFVQLCLLLEGKFGDDL